LTKDLRTAKKVSRSALHDCPDATADPLGSAQRRHQNRAASRTTDTNALSTTTMRTRSERGSESERDRNRLSRLNSSPTESRHTPRAVVSVRFHVSSVVIVDDEMVVGCVSRVGRDLAILLHSLISSHLDRPPALVSSCRSCHATSASMRSSCGESTRRCARRVERVSGHRASDALVSTRVRVAGVRRASLVDSPRSTSVSNIRRCDDGG
jgi:hypothetical protein